ncbi:MAG: S8 family serine peptidase, partial [Gammaproteobacteria bacterium]|nr:S8 family serine peptidase [Gammaproteobacteria bacterium]
MNRHPLAIALLIWLALFSSHGATAQDRDFYFYNGEPVMLELLTDTRAFRDPTGRMATMSTVVETINTAVDPLDLPRTQREGIRVFRKPENVSDEEFETAINTMAEAVDDHREIPVYRAGRTLMLLTETFTVEFDERATANLDDSDRERMLMGMLATDSKLSVRRDDTVPERPRFKVTFDRVPPRKALRLINDLNSRAEIRVAYPDFIRIHELRTWLDLMKRLRPAPRMALVNLCQHASTGQPPTDPAFGSQWALDQSGSTNAGVCQSNTPNGICEVDTDWLKAWYDLQGGPPIVSVVIAILDVGVQEHPDLRLVTPGINTTNAGDWRPVDDSNRHGTNVAGIAAAVTDNCYGMSGVAPGARILSVRISSHEPESKVWEEFADEAGQGFRQAADKGARVLVNSWWINEPSPPDQFIRDEIWAAIVDHDALIVVAAGNMSILNYPDECWKVGSNWQCNSGVRFPAKLAGDLDGCLKGGVVAVSASTQADEFKTVELYGAAPT